MNAGGVVLVGGEALVDMVLTDSGELRVHPGGAAYNVARAIARLGRPVSYLGRISKDRLGARLRQGLEEDGVLLDTALATDDPTTLAIAEIDGAGLVTYRFYTEGTSTAGLTAEAALTVVPDRLDVIHVGGLGLVLEPMAGALEAVVDAAAENTLVFLDPNCRPSATADVSAYRSRLNRVLARTDVVKASEEDLAWLEPGLTPAEAGRELLKRGPAVVLVTRGAKPVLVLTAIGELAVPARPVEVIDTIGAGDAFGGGFIAWWHEQGLSRVDLADLVLVGQATAFAAAVSAMTCARAGADSPRADELLLGVGVSGSGRAPETPASR